MTRNLIRESKRTLIMKNLASGTSDPFGQALDMQGYNSVLFTAIQTSGATTGNIMTGYNATSSTATSTSDGWTIISSSATITSPNQAGGSTGKGILEMDIVHPQKRFVTAKLTRGTATAFGGILATQYGSPRMISSTKASTDALATAVLIHPQSTG